MPQSRSSRAPARRSICRHAGATPPREMKALARHLPINGTQNSSRSGDTALSAWSTLERAAIGELVDLGTALAVPYLTELTGDDVALDCVLDAVRSRRENAHRVQSDFKDEVALVAQGFSGSLDGNLAVLFPERLRIAISGGAIFQDGEIDPALIAIARFGEVLLTQSLAGLATTLGLELEVGPPVVAEGFPYDVILKDPNDADEPTFLFSLELGIDGRSAPAILLMAVKDSSEAPLKRFLHEFLATEAGHHHRH